MRVSRGTYTFFTNSSVGQQNPGGLAMHATSGSLRRHRGRLRSVALGLAIAAAVTVGTGPQPVFAAAHAATQAAGYDDGTEQQLRADQCLLSNVLRKGGPAMKQVASAGLDGDAAHVHAAAEDDYWDTTPLHTAYQSDNDAELAKLDQLQTIDENLTNANGTLELEGLSTPESNPSLPPDIWGAATPDVSDPFDQIGFGSWVSQSYWTTEDSFYDDPTPLASGDSVAAVTALGNGLFHDPDGSDPDFQRDLAEYDAWQDMSFMHDYYADDTRIVLENGGFPRTAPEPGSAEFRIAVEDLKSRFASCASTDPVDPNGVLGPELSTADSEWQAEIAGQQTQRDALYADNAKAATALSTGTEALGRTLVAAEQADLLTYWTAYWSPGGPGVAGSGPIIFKPAGGSNICLDNKGAGTANGNPVQAYTCNSSASQQWKPYEGDTTDGELRNPNGKCLQAAGTTSGSKIQLYTCNGGSTEHWQYLTTKGSTRLYNVGAKLCAAFTTAASGQAALVKTCDGSTSQKFVASQDNAPTADGDKSLDYPTAAEFTQVKNTLTALRTTAAAQAAIVGQQAAAAKTAADDTTAQQQQAYGVADAAGEPRGRGLLSGQQEAQVTLAASAALSAQSGAAQTAAQATGASVADSQTITAQAQTQAADSEAAFKLAAAQAADAQAKAEAQGAAQQAANAAAQATTAKNALATAQAAEATAKTAAATAHTKRLAAEAQQQQAAQDKQDAAADEAKASQDQSAADADDQNAQAALAAAQSAQATADSKSQAAQKADSDARQAAQEAWDAQADRNALQAKADAADAHADAESSSDDAQASRDAADAADQDATDASNAADSAQQNADAASQAAAQADADATRAEAAASRAQADADDAASAKKKADAALRTDEAAAATAVQAAQQASTDAKTAQHDAAAAEADAKSAADDAADATQDAQDAQATAATAAGYAYTTAQAATAATQAAQTVTDPANDAIQLGAPYVDSDSSAGLAVLTAQASKTIAEQQQAAAQAKAQQAAQVAADAQALADDATGDAKAAKTAAADAALQAANAAVSVQHALASAAEAQSYAAQAQATVAQTTAYDAQATADSDAAQAAADTAAGDADDARASADTAEQDAAAAQQAASDARDAADSAAQVAAQADAAATAAENAAKDAQAQADSAQQAATLAVQEQNAAELDTGDATGAQHVYTTQKITPIGDPVPQGPCDLGPFDSGCDVSFLMTFKITVDFYLCDTSQDPGAATAGGCPEEDSTYLGSRTDQGSTTITHHFSAWDITVDFDQAFIESLWKGFTADFVNCSHGSITGCAWAASWFIPPSKIANALRAITGLNDALHAGVGLDDAWHAVDALDLDHGTSDALKAEVDDEETWFAPCDEDSFPASTQVLGADGNYHAFSAIRAGDRVMSLDRPTGLLRPAVVTATYSHATHGRMLTLTLAGGGSLTTTDGHVLFTVDRGWLPASALHVGDRLRHTDGSAVPVAAITASAGDGRTVHDMTVDGTHDFYVRTGTSAVLVHNCFNLAKDDALFSDVAHTLKEHVNVTPQQAIDLAKLTRKAGRNSVWTNAQLAQDAVTSVITKKMEGTKQIANWLAKKGGDSQLVFDGKFVGGADPDSLGIVYKADGSSARTGNNVRVTLQRTPPTPKHPMGFFVKTAYPF